MISSLDLSIIVVYLIIVLVIGFLLGRKEKSEGFFTNNRRTKIFLLIFSVISTSIGAGTVIGTASAAYNSGISYGLTFIIISVAGWTFMGWIAPRIKKWSDKTGSFTLGDFFFYRYDKKTGQLVSFIILVSTFLMIGVQFVAFASLSQVIIGVDFLVASILAASITIIYTAVSGIKGDIYTDAIQFFVMLPIFFILFLYGFSEIGFVDLFNNLPPNYLHPFNYAGPSFFFAGAIFGFLILFVSMDIWQRVFAAFDEKTARNAFYFSAILKIVAISSAIIFGLMAIKIVPGIDSDMALFDLMKNVLPRGLLGVGFASVLAVLMSSVDSTLMVGSATITKNFFLARNKDIPDKKILNIGRISVGVLGIGGLLAALIFQDIVRLAVTSIQLVGIIGPALIGGFFWKRSDGRAAFLSILSGFIVTLFLLPKMPDVAALPGIVVAALVFIFYSLKSNKKFHLLDNN